MDRREKRWVIRAMVGGMVLLYLVGLDAYWDTGGDNARYIILGQALATRQGYRLINMPTAPLPMKLPPIFPFLLSAGLRLMGPADFQNHWWLLKLFSAIPFLLAMLPFYRMASPRLGRYVGIALLLGWTNPWLYRYANIVRPEGLYTLFSFMALALFARVETSEEMSWSKVIDAALMAALASLTRTIGWSLILAFVASLALQRRWKTIAVAVAVYGFTMTRWFLHFHQTSAPLMQDSYLRELSGGLASPWTPAWFLHLVKLMQIHLVTYAQAWAGAFFYLPLRLLGGLPWIEEIIGAIVGALIIVAILWGMREAWRRGERALALYTGGYLLITWVWPWQGEKFLVPLLPIALYLILAAVVQHRPRVGGAWEVPWLEWGLALLLLVNVVGLTGWYAHRCMEPYPPAWQRYREVAEWSRRELPADAVVMARKPYLFYLWSGHWTVPYPSGWEDEDVMHALEAQEASYVVVGEVRPLDEGRMKSWIEDHPAFFRLRLSLEEPRTLLYEVDK